MPGRVHQVGLAHTHAAIEKQRVVSLGRLLGDGAGRGVRKFVGLADDECFEGVARLELIVAALEVQSRLFNRDGGWRRRCGVFLGADVLHFQARHAKFMKNGANNFAVRTGQHLPEDYGRDLYVYRIAVGAVQARRSEPSREGIQANP